MSLAEETLAAQLESDRIFFEREVQFAPEDWCLSMGFVTPTGRPKRWRADFMVGQNFAWPVRGRFLVECDGGSWVGGRHVTGTGFESDLEKLNAAALLGFRVLRFTPSMIADGRALAVIRAALGLAEKAA